MLHLVSTNCDSSDPSTQGTRTRDQTRHAKDKDKALAQPERSFYYGLQAVAIIRNVFQGDCAGKARSPKSHAWLPAMNGIQSLPVLLAGRSVWTIDPCPKKGGRRHQGVSPMLIRHANLSAFHVDVVLDRFIGLPTATFEEVSPQNSESSTTETSCPDCFDMF